MTKFSPTLLNNRIEFRAMDGMALGRAQLVKHPCNHIYELHYHSSGLRCAPLRSPLPQIFPHYQSNTAISLQQQP